MTRLKAWLRSLLSLWVWLEICLVASIGLLLVAGVRLLTFPFDPTRRLAGRAFRLVAVAAIKLSPMWTFRVVGELPRALPVKLVVVSNHVSHLDAFLISHLPWEMKWLAKCSLFRLPVLGQLMRLAGDVAVNRGDKASADAALGRCALYLRQAMPIFIFPEGTRAKGDTLLPFKLGAFSLAIREGATVLPVAVAGTREALPKHAWRFAYAKGLVTVGDPIETDGLKPDDAAMLAARARSQIEGMLKTLRPLSRVAGT